MRKPKSKAMRRRDFLIRSYIVLLSVILVLSLSAIVTQTACATTYVITDGEKTVTDTTFETDPAQVLGQAGVPLEEYDTYTTETVEGGAAITISRAGKVTVHYHGQTMIVSSREETAGQLLQRLGLEITGEDVVSHGLEEKIQDGMVLSVDRIITSREVFSSAIPHEIQYREDENLPAGTERIEAEAFMNNVAIQEVVVPHGCSYIGNRAFAGCTELRRVYIPVDTVVETDAFEGCPQVRIIRKGK